MGFRRGRAREDAVVEQGSVRLRLGSMPCTAVTAATRPHGHIATAATAATRPPVRLRAGSRKQRMVVEMGAKIWVDWAYDSVKSLVKTNEKGGQPHGPARIERIRSCTALQVRAMCVEVTHVPSTRFAVQSTSIS